MMQKKSVTYEFFNQKLTYNFGNGASYEIDMPQIINDYDKIVFRNDNLLFFNGNDNVSVGKNSISFENLPPERILTAGTSSNYTLVSGDDAYKLYEVTYTSSYNTPNGGQTNTNVLYELYLKENNRTLEIIGTKQENVLKIYNCITTTDNIKTLEEQFHGITVLDNRILDTSKLRINEIYNIPAYIDVSVNTGIDELSFIFTSSKDTVYLPGLKKISNWDLISEKDGYQVYHGTSPQSVQSDALKVVKDNKSYFIDLSIPISLYTTENVESDGLPSFNIYVTEENLEKIVTSLFDILKK